MPKLPFMRFYPADYIIATRSLTDTEKAIWMDLLCFMWLKPENRGNLEHHRDDLARMIGRDRLTLDITLEALCSKGVCVLKDRQDQVVFVECRRMVRDSKQLELTNKRVKRFNALNNAGLTQTLTPKMSDVRRQIKNTGDYEIPNDLLESEAEIKDWLEYKKQRSESYKPKGLEALWRQFRAIPAGRRRASVDQSMANNWAGLFERRDMATRAKEGGEAWMQTK